MNPTYMVHPEHGVHIAYTADEVERCKTNGWTLRDEPEAAVVEVAQEAPKPKRKYVRKAA